MGAPRKTHCIRGHARTPENLNSIGACKACHNLLVKEARRASSIGKVFDALNTAIDADPREFWTVWGGGRANNRPSARFDTIDEARDAAETLAKDTPGRPIYVMAAVGRVVFAPPVVAPDLSMTWFTKTGNAAAAGEEN